MFKTNHITENIITKGIINSFPLFDGILTQIEYEIITPTKKHGGIGWVDLKKDIHKVEDPTTIIVNVNWYKTINRDKSITVEQVEKEIRERIQVELINAKKDINIEIEFIK